MAKFINFIRNTLFRSKRSAHAEEIDKFNKMIDRLNRETVR